MKMKMLLSLFFGFFKVGLFTFGGGSAMLPLLQKEFVENKKWLTNEELVDFYAVSQSTPGIIALNTATFLGYRKAGIRGAILATLGVVMPSLIIIMLIATVLKGYMDNKYVKHAFEGIAVVVIAIIFDAVVKLWKSAVKGPFCIVMFGVGFLALLFFGISPAILVVGASAVGYVYRVKFMK